MQMSVLVPGSGIISKAGICSRSFINFAASFKRSMNLGECLQFFLWLLRANINDSVNSPCWFSPFPATSPDTYVTHTI